MPGIIEIGVLGVAFRNLSDTGGERMNCHLTRETLREVVIRAGKVYLFIIALVFLREGSKSFVLEYLLDPV